MNQRRKRTSASAGRELNGASAHTASRLRLRALQPSWMGAARASFAGSHSSWRTSVGALVDSAGITGSWRCVPNLRATQEWIRVRGRHQRPRYARGRPCVASWQHKFVGGLHSLSRVIADAARGFDRIRPGYHGPLYAEISPRTFPVLVREGSRLSQIRFRHGHAVLAGAALAALHERERLVDTAAPDLSDGVPVGVDLRGVDQAGVALGAIADETVSPKTSLRTSEMGLVS
jgi:hypothetical protein